MGSFYAETVAALGGRTHLAGVVDPDPKVRERVQGRLGVEHGYADIGVALEQAALDAVIVATPTSAHADAVLAVASSKKPIFCEKPLALTVSETQRVLEGVQRAGVLLQIGFMRRFDPAHAQAKAAIQSGKIGRPLTYR